MPRLVLDLVITGPVRAAADCVLGPSDPGIRFRLHNVDRVLRDGNGDFAGLVPALDDPTQSRQLQPIESATSTGRGSSTAFQNGIIGGVT